MAQVIYHTLCEHHVESYKNFIITLLYVQMLCESKLFPFYGYYLCGRDP